MKPLVIIGAGGSGRDLLGVIDAVNQDDPRYEALGYVVDAQYGSPGTVINEKPILGGFDWLSKRSRESLAICGVGPPHHRYQLVRRAEAMGCRFFSVIHPTAVLTRWIQLGEGVVITAGCVLTNQIRIGNHVQVNLDCTIAHDAILEDFVTLAPGVHISGNATVREGAYVGTGSNLVEKLEIGEWSTIIAGSAVVSYYLNSYYNGRIAGYGLGAHVRDMPPYVGAAGAMGAGASALTWPSVVQTAVLLLIQVVVGSLVYGLLCLGFRLPVFMAGWRVFQNKIAARRMIGL